jgi:ribulose-bisphosphate carboxylase large chain
MYEKLRTIDFGMVPGRGVFGHPMGPRAGAASLRQAWAAVVNRISLKEFASDSPELREAIRAFGKKDVEVRTLEEDMAAPRGFTGVPLFLERN